MKYMRNDRFFGYENVLRLIFPFNLGIIYFDVKDRTYIKTI
ncbi:hypothetical protein DAD75_06320 [Streptococcus agalactiae]|nr:hypothetical protein DAD76_08005 [Streptococcus agalactiae]TQB90069.1 hypothetical protein DAD75_06320 [Streptococcus agalactiae]